MRLPVSAASSARADVDRDHRLQRPRLLAAAQREAPQRARAGGEHRVVDGDAVAAAHARSSSSGRDARSRWRAGEPGRLSSELRAGGSTVWASVRDAAARGAPGRVSSRRGELASFSGASAQRRAVLGAVGDRLGEPLARRRGRRRGPAVRRVAVGGVGSRSSSSARELQRRDAVDHAVVGLADHARSGRRQLRGEPHLPQRPVARERRRRRRRRPARRACARRLAVQVIAGSKSSSSTHTGSCTASGTSASRWR